MNPERPIVACPACGRLHPGHANSDEPHYCSIACYRAGHGLDDPHTGDGRRLCPGCQRYFEPVGHRRHCSAACRVAEWRRQQQPSTTTTTPKPTMIDVMTLQDVMTEHAPVRYVAHDSAAVIDEALRSLGTLRGLQWVGDGGAVLHVLASLSAQIDELLPAAITDARDQHYSWSEIAALLGTTRQRAQRLAAQHQRTPLAD